ncbi:MAG: carbohydrate ABC transporter permease, partial [Ruminiclostridium sp.]|nr:carbohydrate ABC transporter permease [Ruminiclostridium sp.]
PGRNVLLMVVVVTLFFSGGLIPSYLLIAALGMKDSWWALIVPYLISPWYMLILRKFFGEVPVSLLESAKIEGASEVTVLSRIILPLSLPSIAVIGLFYAVYHWNAWFPAAIYIDTREKYPLQLALRTIVQTLNLEELSKRGYDVSKIYVSEANVKAAAIIITVAPILCVYPFLQKHFVKGMFLGSIKG